MATNWTVADAFGDYTERHYSFNDTGFDDAVKFAERNRLCVWQSFDGSARYLMWTPRALEDAQS